jgi:hypothetical protein
MLLFAKPNKNRLLDYAMFAIPAPPNAVMIDNRHQNSKS